MAETTGAGSVSLIGGALCLDFVNTVGDIKSEHPYEHLTNYSDLVAWSKHAGILTPRLAQHLIQTAAQHPAEATAVYQRALTLRAALYRTFAARLAEYKPRTSDLAVLNETLAEAMSHAHIVTAENGYAWDWTGMENDLAQMLYPIARSAADILTSDNLARVRECEDDECGWLFVDTSKNHSRRWCSMDDCGNRAKARRHYRLTRAK